MPKYANTLVSNETFTRLHKAMLNLFAFGPFAGLEVPIYNSLHIDEGMMVSHGENGRPTHKYSGEIVVPGLELTKLQVWKMYEGSSKSTATVHDGQVIQPMTVMQEDVAGLHHRSDYILTTDKRFFKLSSDRGTYDEAQISLKVEESEAEVIAEWIEVRVAALGGIAISGSTPNVSQVKSAKTVAPELYSPNLTKKAPDNAGSNSAQPLLPWNFGFDQMK